MELLNGKTLIDRRGTPIAATTALRGIKYILYYFSASYSKPCETLLPKLKQIHLKACARHSRLEIVYISFDTSTEQTLGHFKKHHGNWFAVPFGDLTAAELQYRFGVTSIPYIVVVKNNETIVTRRGKAEIEELGVNVLVTWIG